MGVLFCGGYSAKITTPYIIDSIKKQTNLLDGIKRNQKIVDNYRKLTEKEEVVKKSVTTHPHLPPKP